MKLKDIERKLKSEQEGKSVPEVYSKVSKAPLNKLLSGETPVRAFQKQLVMRLLIFVLVIFLVAAIGLSAMWLTPAESNGKPDCYASITVSGDSGEMRIGLILSGGKKIMTTVVEVANGKTQIQPIVSHSAQIGDFIKPKSGDKVRVELLSNAPYALTDSMRFIVGELEYIYSGVAFDMSTTANSATTRSSVTQYIKACKGEIADDAKLEDIIKAYSVLFA